MIDLGRKLIQWEQDPDRPRIEGPDEFISNGDFARRVRERAAKLDALGVGPGSVVAVSDGRGTGFLSDLVAVRLLEAVAVPVSPQQCAQLTTTVRPTLILAESTEERTGPLDRFLTCDQHPGACKFNAEIHQLLRRIEQPRRKPSHPASSQKAATVGS